MSLKNWTPCDEPDMNGFHHCPYAEDGEYVNCEYWCGAIEPQDDPTDWEDDEPEEDDGWNEWECEPSCDDWDDLEMGFDPYLGSYTDDC